MCQKRHKNDDKAEKVGGEWVEKNVTGGRFACIYQALQRGVILRYTKLTGQSSWANALCAGRH